MLSIIIPTYNEADNIKKIVPELFRIFSKSKIKAEVIVIDDNSPDGTADIVKSLQKQYNVKLVLRKEKSGLSSAVIDGFGYTSFDKIAVTDADLSHDISKIPKMFKELEHADLVIGSRYMKGGGIKNWKIKRKIISRFANLLAKPLTSVSDPVSGFFLLKKSVIKGVELNHIGYKIGLEIIVKGRYNRIKEVAYTFTDRKIGKSKMDFSEIWNYLKQVFGLYGWKIKSIFFAK